MGDIIFLEEGNIVPASGILIEGSLVLDQVDQTFLDRKEAWVGNLVDPLIPVYQKVVEGQAKMLVFVVYPYDPYH